MFMFTKRWTQCLEKSGKPQSDFCMNPGVSFVSYWSWCSAATGCDAVVGDGAEAASSAGDDDDDRDEAVRVNNDAGDNGDDGSQLSPASYQRMSAVDNDNDRAGSATAAVLS